MQRDVTNGLSHTFRFLELRLVFNEEFSFKRGWTVLEQIKKTEKFALSGED